MPRVLPLLVMLCACAGTTPVPSPDAVIAPLVPDGPAVLGISDPALRAVLDVHWAETMVRYPEWATTLGDHRYDDRLSDPSLAAESAWRDRLRAFRDQARALPVDGLSEGDRVSRALFLEELDHAIRQEACKTSLWGVSARGNAYGASSQLPQDLLPTSPERAASLRARYAALPGWIQGESDNLREGLKQGLVANAASVQLVVDQLQRELDKPVTEWPHWQAVTLAEGLEPAALAEHTEAVRTVLDGPVRQAFQGYLALLRDEVLPKARGDGKEGLVHLPIGEACYTALVQQYTTLPEATAQDLHETGLRELQSIHAEFRDLGAKALGTGDLQQVFTRLRTDPELYFTTEDEVEAKAVAALDRARQAMPKAFGRLPERPCTVARIPDHEAPYTTIAYYRPPTADQDGQYFINTYAPTTRPRHEAEVLAYHESIPGHHLQIAIGQELPELPAFRKHGGMTAFVEGWALYTERMVDELGLYSGDLDRLGMLSFDAWRASRLVVDTGLHHKGWSREQAVQFMLENTPLAENNIRNEVDRYITTPGQALAYKTGQLEIWRLRRDAETRLGERFDLRGFHDVVLGAGAVSLPVLRERVEAWVSAQTP